MLRFMALVDACGSQFQKRIVLSELHVTNVPTGSRELLPTMFAYEYKSTHRTVKY
jgi:hypothetical protein